jgi:hypothetical protein
VYFVVRLDFVVVAHFVTLSEGEGGRFHGAHVATVAGKCNVSAAMTAPTPAMLDQVQKEERQGDNRGRCHHCGLKSYGIFHAILLGLWDGHRCRQRRPLCVIALGAAPMRRFTVVRIVSMRLAGVHTHAEVPAAQAIRRYP